MQLPVVFAPQPTVPKQLWLAGYDPPPTPLKTFVIKLTSVCNLDCLYCYEYKAADQSWRLQDRFMSEVTLREAVRRIAEHARAWKLPFVFLVLHGGEPLLLGHKRFDRACRVIHEGLSGLEFGLAVQSNGTLVDEEFVRIFKRHRVQIGLSVDGPPRWHDRTRIDFRGKGTSQKVALAVKLLRREPDVFGGMLCVVNIEADPEEVYDYFARLDIPSLNFLLPDNHHANPPARVRSPADARVYAGWLRPIFSRWYDAPVKPNVTMFTSIMRLLLGFRTLSDAFGNDAGGQCIVAANGAIESLDVLKTCYAGATATGLNVFSHSMDEASRQPNIRALGAANQGLCRQCQDCPFLPVCGGGYFPHRYDGSGFVNPSVYCHGLQELITTVARRMADDFHAAHLPLPPLVARLASP